LKDEIAQEIVSELRLIREELQNLTMAVRSASTSRNSENSYRGKPPKFYPRRAANPPDVRHSQGHKPPRSPQRGEPRSQWHQNAQRTRDSSQKAIRRLPPTGCGALSWRGTTVPGQLLRTERINAGTYPDSIAILGANSSFSSPLNYCSLANNQPLS
jgi:hypothetical protein